MTNAKDRRRSFGRRALMQWSLAAGAALGLPRWKVFEVLELTGGRALADAAACLPCNRSVHLIAGRGGFAWFQLLWPHNDVAAAGNDRFAWHAAGDPAVVVRSDTHRPLTLGPEAPWRDLPGGRQVTCLMGGVNETHTRTPAAGAVLGTNVDLFAACAAVQTASPSLVPVIGVGEINYGTAPGAPRIARVGAADDIVALFNSAASRAGGLLADAPSADLFATQYEALLSLHRAAGTPSVRSGMATGMGAARLLGRNLAEVLRPTDADFTRYGINAASRTQNRELAKSLIITAKAFRSGLTSSVIVPAFLDDPHGAFTDMTGLRRNLRETGASLDAFLADLAVADPSCGGRTLADNTVISIHGDTPKTPLNRANWPDGTPGNSNWIYVLSAGHLKTGWFGGIQRDGTVHGWNPLTGTEIVGGQSSTTSSPAAAAVLHAVTRGDVRRVSDFYRGTDIRGVVSDPTV